MAEGERTRRAVNEVIPGLLQRGKTLTWPREIKVHHFREWNVNAMVNFWPKVDPDLGEMELDWYWQLSCPRSEGMLQPRMMFAAEVVADYIAQRSKPNVLVLCEAGKTRSVFFCVLVVALARKWTYIEALEHVSAAVGSISMKPFMLDWIKAHSKPSQR